MSWNFLVSTPTLIIVTVLLAVLVAVGYLRAPSHPQRRRVIHAIRRSVLSVLMVVCLAGPSVPAEIQETVANVEIYLVVDRTGSMVAEDYDGSSPRLDGVKANLETLLETTAGSRYAVITWDSSARLELPVTTDASAVASFVEVLHQEITDFSTGSSMNRPLSVLRSQLEAAAESRPQNLRYVVIFTDGESTDSSDQEVSAEWETLSSLIDGGAVFGYGTEAGGKMLSYQRSVGQTGEYILDTTQAGSPEAVSYLDQESLEQLANYLGVDLLVNPSTEQVQAVGEEIMASSQDVSEERTQIHTTRYVIWPFATAAALLVVWEAAEFASRLVGLRRSRAI